MDYTEPYVRTPEDVVQRMLSLASVRPGERVFDLGSGDGRMLIAAARDFGASAVGVERRKRLVAESRRRVRELGLSKRVKVINADWSRVSLRKADVLATFLSSYTLELLEPKLKRELRPGARLVNFDFPIPGWEAAGEVELVPAGWRRPHSIYLYVVPSQSWPIRHEL